MARSHQLRIIPPISSNSAFSFYSLTSFDTGNVTGDKCHKNHRERNRTLCERKDMDPYEPYRPQKDMYKIESSPPPTTGVRPTERLLRTKMVAADFPDDTKAERFASDAKSVASIRTYASNASRLREQIHGDRLRGVNLHWALPGAIVGLLILGLLGSLLHHWYYLRLDGERADDQFTATWFGNALAFLTKAALVGSITLAYRFVGSTGLW